MLGLTLGIGLQKRRKAGGSGPQPVPGDYGLLISSIDELDPPTALLHSGDEQPAQNALKLSGDH